jgi:hypothetical protein
MNNPLSSVQIDKQYFIGKQKPMHFSLSLLVLVSFVGQAVSRRNKNTNHLTHVSVHAVSPQNNVSRNETMSIHDENDHSMGGGVGMFFFKTTEQV